MNNNIYNQLIGGDIYKMNTYISNYFKTYNLISWNINKLYASPENDKLLKEYCESMINLNICDPPYESTILTNTIDDCCKFKEIGISKRSINRFNINSIIIKDNLNFKFLKDFPQITIPNAKTLLYLYIKQLIIQNINNITQKQYDNIINILQENDYNTNNIIDTINSNDFYESDTLLNIYFQIKNIIMIVNILILKK